MELRQVEYFVAVAEERHFGRAADRLHIGQPAVSQQIRRLERELGVDLLDRSPRHVRLTAAGQRFLPEARAILAAVARARTSVSGIGQTLHLGTSTGLGSHLDRILDRLAVQAPNLTVELISARTAERFAQVARGELDAAFVRDSPAHEEPSDVALAEASGAGQRGQAAGQPALRHIPLWPDPLLAVLPARHPLAQAADVALADLAPLPVRLTDRRNNPALVDLLVTAFHDAGLELRPGPPTASLQDTHAAIGAAGGDPERATWTVVYASHASHLQNPRVAFLPFRETRLEMVTSLVVRRDKPTPHLAALLAACADDHDS